MKEKNILIKTIECLVLIPLYYIAGKKGIFLYVLSLSLYNIFLSCFKHITIKEKLKKIPSLYIKKRLFTTITLIISIISLIFLILSILVSDIISSILNINNIFLVFLSMGLTIAIEPILNILTEYLAEMKTLKISKIIYNLYYILNSIFIIILSLIAFRIFDLSNNLAVSLLYFSKIISISIISGLSYIILKTKKITKTKEIYDYKNEIKKILTKNSSKSLIDIVKNTYYYISIILLYLILSTRYNYAISDIQENISFIYLYGLSIINYLISIIEIYITKKYKDIKTPNYLYFNFKIMLTLSIVLSIISPLITKIIFYDHKKSIYLTMLNFLAIFISLYNITFENLKNKKIIYTSLIVGLFTKLILTIPLINSFYRLGYNLIYGDILSTIISMLVSIIINYIYLKNKYKKEEKFLEKILKTLYETIILCIIMILFQFIIPIKADSYFKSIGLIIIYISISIIFLKIKNMKRG